MNGLKGLGVALVVCLSLVVNVIACVLIAMSMRQQPPISDADVVVAGVGNSGNTFGGGASVRRMARLAAERDVAPPVGDATLRQTAVQLIERAKQGDVEAAAFVFELAEAQRTKAGGAATTAPAGH
ncbi:MAG TPA: hypothetical protein VFB66_01925 [Tepidisphaeraceae bacterium]|nr:hypothetical protein [Tepidisphaeraceae bacterium]